MTKPERRSPSETKRPTPASTAPENAGTQTSERVAYEAGKTAGDNLWLLYAVGGASILAGFFAILMPFVASLAAAVTLGAALIFAGVAGLFAAFRRRDYWHMACAFGLALLSLVTGGLMLVQPIAGIIALTTLIAAWFGASGALRIYYGAKQWPGAGSGWAVFSGVVSVLLAFLLWFGLPFNAAWVPGLLLGLDLMLWGAILLALALRSSRPAAPVDAS